MEKKYTKRHANDLQAIFDEHSAEEEPVERPKETICGTIRTFKWQFWIFNVIIFLAFSTFVPFFANISMLLRGCYGFTLVESGELMALASLTVTLMCPLIGYVSDKI